MLQSLLNLLSNAVKFTTGGKIILQVYRETVNNEEWVKFVVKDTGIGLSESQMESLFSAFSQADMSTTRRYGGTGLGLTISQKFCRLMGGEISVESELGKGSVFTISLPSIIKQPAVSDAEKQIELQPIEEHKLARVQQIDQRELKDERRSKRSTILIIDDDPMACEIQQRHLGKHDYNVICVKSGEEGIKKINQLSPDVILLDVMLTDMSGWQVLDILFKHDPCYAGVRKLRLRILEKLCAADTCLMSRNTWLHFIEKEREILSAKI